MYAIRAVRRKFRNSLRFCNYQKTIVVRLSAVQLAQYKVHGQARTENQKNSRLRSLGRLNAQPRNDVITHQRLTDQNLVSLTLLYGLLLCTTTTTLYFGVRYRYVVVTSNVQLHICMYHKRMGRSSNGHVESNVLQRISNVNTNISGYRKVLSRPVLISRTDEYVFVNA